MTYLDTEKIKQKEREYKKLNKLEPLNLSRIRDHKWELPAEPEPPFKTWLLDRQERLETELNRHKHSPPVPDIVSDIMNSLNSPIDKQLNTATCRVRKTTRRNFPNILSVEEEISFSGDCDGVTVAEESSVGLDVDIDRRMVFLGMRHRRKISR